VDFTQKLRKAASKIDYLDLRISKSASEEIGVENGNIAVLKKEFGFRYGIRTFYRGAWGFAHANNIDIFDKVLSKAIKLAKLNSKKVKEKFQLGDFPANRANIKFSGKDPSVVDTETKLKRINEISKQLERKNVNNRTVNAAFLKNENSFFNSSGSAIHQKRYAYSLRCVLVGKSNNQVSRVFHRVGKSCGYEDFAKNSPKKIADETYERLLRAFKAKQAPAGRLPVVIDPLLCGVFFHEAVGHACEADAILEKSSVLTGMIGKKIATEHVTLSDTPKIKTENGYYSFDSEGIPAGETILINKGSLNSFLQSRETASRMGVAPTGNGRAESPECLPYPRMSNIVLKPGDYSLAEALNKIKFGVYAKGSSGGVVEPANGNFLFNSQEAFLIENGRITKPLKDVSFGGNILEVLPKIEIVCKDAKETYMGGFCGKKGQLVPVGEFAPHIKISEAVIGGSGKGAR
jgi:TldD protein